MPASCQKNFRQLVLTNRPEIIRSAPRIAVWRRQQFAISRANYPGNLGLATRSAAFRNTTSAQRVENTDSGVSAGSSSILQFEGFSRHLPVPKIVVPNSASTSRAPDVHDADTALPVEALTPWSQGRPSGRRQLRVTMHGLRWLYEEPCKRLRWGLATHLQRVTGVTRAVAGQRKRQLLCGALPSCTQRL